jgi:hypothetical protein
MRVLLRSLRATYLTVDPRSLGLFRIALGCVLFWDLWHRYTQFEFWYTNSGLLPNHTLLWRPPAGHIFSLFFVASTRTEALLGFAACAVVYALFTLGYRTKTMQVLALICRVSLNSRLAMLENGGDMVVNVLCIFSLVLPLGRRFSLDAWIGSLRDGRVTSVDDLNSAPHSELERQPVVSPAMLGLILQFAVIYFFNALSKQGEAWTSGYAVHYALHLDKYVTWIGVWMRDNVPVQAMRVLTWSVLCAEWVGFTLLITPIGVKYARTLAVFMLPVLHLCFALRLNLGTFSPAMMSFYPLLLTRRHWEAFGRFLERRSTPITVEFDCTDARLFQTARVLRELDRSRSITWSPVSTHGWRVSETEQAAPPDNVRRLVEALPWGFLLGLPLRLPALRSYWLQGLRAAAQWSIQAASAPPRERLSRFASSPSARLAVRWVTSAAVLLLIAAIATQIVVDNANVPAALRVPQPAWAKAVIEYPRLLQGWRMFAPEPPRFDTMIHVDATTAGGTHVDPYNAVASRQTFPEGDVVPERMDQSQWFTMYSDRIADPGYAPYRTAFLEWLLAYPERTGKPADCLTSFDVYLITDESPAPGTGLSPKPSKRERFMQYKAPADSKCMSLQLSATIDALGTRR